MREIDYIIIHCAATPEGRDVSTETIKSWHVDGRGWSDIGYHYVIELDGTIGQGRDLDRSGAHTKGQNARSIGVCYVGGLEAEKTDGKYKPKDTLFGEQLDSMESLLKGLMDKYPNAKLAGHNEFANKACPSFQVSEKFAHLIEE